MVFANIEEKRAYNRTVSKRYRARQNAWRNKKYASNLDFRERQLKHNRKYQKEKLQLDPLWRRRWHLSHYYNLTPEEFDCMLKEQDNRCKMPDCRAETPGGKGTWKVDHDHATGKVRGLLCYKCNLSLGHFEKGETRRLIFESYLHASR